MKTLSRASKLVTLAAIGVLAILAFRAFAQAPPPAPAEPDASKATFVLKIKNASPVKDTEHFKQVLKQLNTKLYSVHIKHGTGKSDEDIAPSPGGAKLNIKTDRITASELAKSGAGELTPIGIHVTQQVASNSPADIQTVLNELQQ